MGWDQGYREPKIRLWEGLVFAALLLLIMVVVVGDYLGVSRLILGCVFMFIPVVFVFCIMAIDQMRGRF